MLAERHRRTVQAGHDAEQLAAAAEEDRIRYDQRLLEQRHKMAQEAEAARHNAIAASNDEIAGARTKIGLDLAHRREIVARQVEDARRALAAEAEQVAAEMLARVARSGTRMTRLLSFVLTILLPLAALAEDIPESHHVPGIPWAKLAFTAVNFSIFVYIISRSWPTMRDFMSSAATRCATRSRRPTGPAAKPRR